MGDRCTIGTENSNVNLYLHWESDLENVTALLDYCCMMAYRSMSTDPWYGLARLAQVACNTIGCKTGLSVGIADYRENWDNGHYVVEGWHIVKRVDVKYTEEDGSIALVPDEDRVWENVKHINECQPEEIQMDEDMLRAKWEITCFNRHSCSPAVAENTEE